MKLRELLNGVPVASCAVDLEMEITGVSYDSRATQPGDLFRLLTPDAQQRLFENTARAIGGAPKAIQLRHIGNCLKCDPAYGAGVAKALDISLDALK